MHLANGAITPECAAITFTAAALGLGAAAATCRHEMVDRRRLALAGGLGLMVLAAQAINVPILPAASAHLVGGALLAWALGPGLGALTMAAILAIQAFAFHDGGVLALGANICNMALIPAGMVAAIKRVDLADWKASWKPAVIATVSVPLAAVCIVGETALFRDAAAMADWSQFAAQMITVHLGIGLAEGGLTLLLVAALAAAGQANTWRPAIAATAAAGILATCVPLSSSLPDGYEAAAQDAGLSHLLSE
jgi:cobalt/nickel transport system permease protein